VTPFAAQLRAELQVTARNGEQLLVTLGIPVLLLVFFSQVDVLPTGDQDPIDFLTPGVLALAVMSTAMVSLGIATGFERSYRVLKRLGATPLGRGRLIGAKIAAVAAVELVQVLVLVPTAYALGWSPSSPQWALAVAGVAVGTLAFGGIGLALAGRLRGEVNLAVQNGLYLVMLLLGGIVVPFSEMPTPLRAIGRVLPSGALSEVLHAALGATGSAGWSWVVLVAWAVAAPLAAAALFRWE
jgi:ABC-2 type transport system permease protein